MGRAGWEAETDTDTDTQTHSEAEGQTCRKRSKRGKEENLHLLNPKPYLNTKT